VQLLPGQEYTIDHVGIKTKKEYILPTFQLAFRRTCTPRDSRVLRDCNIFNIIAQVSIEKDGIDHVVSSHITTDSYMEVWKPRETGYLNFEVRVDHYTLSEIERIREGGNLHLKINVKFLWYATDKLSIEQSNFTAPMIIPKSTWVEEVLPSIGYKDVILVEMPKLKYEKLDGAIVWLVVRTELGRIKLLLNSVCVSIKLAIRNFRIHGSSCGWCGWIYDSCAKSAARTTATTSVGCYLSWLSCWCCRCCWFWYHLDKTAT
jgi:hypothetical protein